MKRIIVIITSSVVALFFIAGPHLFFSNTEVAELSPRAKSGSVEVFITDTGFKPENVTVQEGTSVVWKNESSRKSWPASNPHPVHTDYPHSPEGPCADGFDACKGLEADESYNFRFDEAGEWPYHDHLFPSHGGTVHVTKNPARKHFSVQNFTDKVTRVENFFKSIFVSERNFKDLPFSTQLTIIQSKSAAEGWALLKKSYIVNGEVIGDAHELAHAVGNLAYQESGFEGIEICDPVMAYGCYHGVIEQFLLENGPESIPEAEETCSELYLPQDARYISCIHGMGHGLVSWTGLEVEPALLFCDTIKSEARSNCYDGVFMEYNANKPKGSEVGPAELWDICESLSEKYQESCAKYQIVEAHQVFKGNVPDLLAWCESTGSEALSNVCTTSSGRSIAIAYFQDPATIIALCNNSVSIESLNSCIIAAAEEIVFQKFAGWEESSAVLCNFSTVVDETSTECVDRIQKLQ